MIYNGQYENEGHTVTFLFCEEDNTILITEIFISGNSVSNNERKESLPTAIKFQENLKKYGYDKVS